MEASRNSERVQIENYMKLYSLEACLDEAINDVIEKRPANPYMAIAGFMETKTLPEIIEVKLSCCLQGRGYVGVQANIITNMASFIGFSQYPNKSPVESELLRNYSTQEIRVGETLRGLDPRNLAAIDAALAVASGVDPQVKLALSIACARAGARHKGLPLFRFLAEIAGTTPRLPVPVVTVLNRAVPGGLVKVSQNILVVPSNPSFFDGAIEAILRATHAIQRLLDEGKVPTTIADLGCPSVQMETLAEAIKVRSIGSGYGKGVTYLLTHSTYSCNLVCEGRSSRGRRRGRAQDYGGRAGLGSPRASRRRRHPALSVPARRPWGRDDYRRRACRDLSCDLARVRTGVCRGPPAR